MSNLPALYTIGDTTTGHGPFPPVGYPPSGCSPNVYINSKNVHKVGDNTLPHDSIKIDTHLDTIATGSTSVYVNGSPIAINGKSLLLCPFGPGGTVGGISANNVYVGGGLTGL
jgi:uncharacterized Zn-binding protein involved in type VI secretion